MARALLVVPPFIKYTAGPLLGPSLSKAAALKHGHSCTILDLNAHYIVLRQAGRKHRCQQIFVGDRDKAINDQGESVLTPLQSDFIANEILPGLDFENNPSSIRRVQFGFLDHDHVYRAATFLSQAQFGIWVREKLKGNANSDFTPQLVGVSLLHAGQVIPATTVSILARQIWPDALIVWGGPHISGLGNAVLEKDIEKRKFAADVFVTGHAEQTFADLLDLLRSHKENFDNTPVIQGRRMQPPLSPVFENLGLYDRKLTLPAQSTLGCAYGRCKFCTYPAIEPVPTRLSLKYSVGSVVETAERLGAAVAMKDSLATTFRLSELASCISGRVRWSAYTKLSKSLDFYALDELNACGLSTLEVGLESLLLDTQKRISKVHTPFVFEQFLADAERVDRLSLVVNYMTGFPWENPEEAKRKLDDVVNMVKDYLGHRGMVEHNTFQLERLAPMAKNPTIFKINEGSIKEWPWASILEFGTL